MAKAEVKYRLTRASNAGFDVYRNLVNWTTEDGVLSTRVGYERFNLGVTSWAPFTTTGRIESIASFKQQGQEYLIIEADGALWFVHQSSGSGVLLRKITNWIPPGPTDGRTQYAATQHGIIVVNGRDVAILIQYGLLGDASESAVNATRMHRSLGFHQHPVGVHIYPVNAKSVNNESVRTQQQHATSIAIPSNSSAPGITGKGLGLVRNADNTPKPAGEYEYCWCYVLSDGSRSPVSAMASTKWSLEPETDGFAYAVVLEVPIGPPDTKVREIYRTTNAADDTFAAIAKEHYLVGQIRENVSTRYYDTVKITSGDVTRIQLHASNQSILFPASRPTAIAQFQNRVFVTGEQEPGRIFYSHPGRVHQFSLEDSVSLSRIGVIKRFIQLESLLLAIGSTGIGAIQYNPDNGVFFTSTLSSGQTKFAADTACLVGNYVLILGLDGVYRIPLNDTQTAAGRPECVSLEFNDLINNRINRARFDHACAVYDSVKKEWQCYYTAEGDSFNNHGVVYHEVVNLFSFRKGFPVGCITTDARGAVVFGHDNPAIERGLFVINGVRAMGGVVTTGNENQTTFTPNPPATSIIETGYAAVSPKATLVGDLQFTIGLHSQKLTETNTTVRIKPRGGRAIATGTVRIEDMRSGYGNDFSYYNEATLGADGTAFWLDWEPVDVSFNVKSDPALAFSYIIETTAAMTLIATSASVVGGKNV